jgi:hypothetical protein
MSDDSPHHQQRELLSDEEVFRRVMASPAVQARLEEVLAERRDPNRRKAPGLTREELVEFLREHG